MLYAMTSWQAVGNTFLKNITISRITKPSAYHLHIHVAGADDVSRAAAGQLYWTTTERFGTANSIADMYERVFDDWTVDTLRWTSEVGSEPLEDISIQTVRYFQSLK